MCQEDNQPVPHFPLRIEIYIIKLDSFHFIFSWYLILNHNNLSIVHNENIYKHIQHSDDIPCHDAK